MADQKVSDLPSLNGADVDAADLLYIIDSSAGTAGSKKITVGQYQVAPYSAGTANGVMYLNGSNVVTTGSGLVFDGTNLGIGTSSPGAKLETVASGTAVYFSGGDSAVARRLQFAASTTTNTGDTQNINALGSTGVLAFQINSTEKMRLDSSGNLGLGVTPSAWNSGGNLQLATGKNISAGTGIGLYGNGYFDGAWKYINTAEASGYGQSGGQHQWFTAPSGTAGNAITFTQAMTLDASGNLLVGTTTVGSALTEGFSLQQGGGASQIHIGHTSGIGSGELYAGFSRGGTTIGSISQNGTTAVLYNTTSDRRLKDNIVPAPIASDDIDAIQIVSYEWKSAPDEQVKYGVIAQDLHAVAPQAVLQGDDGDAIEKTWGVDYSKLVPMLIKEIQSLRARVAALEAQ